ncbi:ethanolamine utilization protein EutJ [Pseudothauera rhizosphaerae]|uniref:Ethanolamine utilization protein EutJ n=1 Tax=Pseudothauera rhizosphaerae TaxID=2565932 RepID=A0A4S4AJW8_9RHOO|nr:ethanolamine utilization protein EutJ [Pseudothauera rhizosphaerae]THF59308.1 ethanolamine utilization protein EutJ [Pseudothauera rhizosphaerae]
MAQRDLHTWLNPRLDRAAALVDDGRPVRAAGPLRLGIDLGTSDVVSMVVDAEDRPVAVCLDWADVVRDGVVWDYFGAIDIVRGQLERLQARLGMAFEEAGTSFPPGTDPRISANVIEAAGLRVAQIIDEPSAVISLLGIADAVVVDIGGGTTGIAVVRDGAIVYSGDEPTGGHHVSLTLAGNRRIGLEEAERLKRGAGEEVWPVVRPVFEKMTDIVCRHLGGHRVPELYLSGGSCMLPGVRGLFAEAFPQLAVHLPSQPLFLTPLAIAAYRSERTSGEQKWK